MVSISSASIKSSIIKLILSNAIVIVSRDSCPHCQTLYATISGRDSWKRVTTYVKEGESLYQEMRDAVRTTFGHTTVPAVFIQGRFLGGNSDFQDNLKSINDFLSLRKLEDHEVLNNNCPESKLLN